jgi:hypothetical protein
MSAVMRVITISVFSSGSKAETDSLWKVKLFLGSLGGSHAVLFWILFVGGMLLSNALLTAQTWFMGYWAEQYLIDQPERVSVAL